MFNKIIKTLLIATSLLAATTASAAGEKAPAAAKHNDGLLSMPKISGYLQAGYSYGDKHAGNKSTFQMKRMRLFMTKKINDTFDFKTQLELFGGSKDQHGKSLITVMDAYFNAHVNKAVNFRLGQYFLPFGFENFDISPATLEVINFSNICYRMICRNSISYPDVIDYGRDAGVMIYGDLFHNDDKDFDIMSYQLSVTNGRLPLTVDDNKSKDITGRLTIRPVKNLRIIGSYNYGETPNAVNKHNKQQRYGFGAWYFEPAGLTLRGEYAAIHSATDQGNINEKAAYLLAGYRFGKVLPVVRYEMYRDTKHKASAINKDQILAGVSYEFNKAVKFQLNYSYNMYADDVDSKDGSGIDIMAIVKF